MRLYFGANTGGKFTQDTAGYSKYWWSNPVNSTNVDSKTLAEAVELTASGEVMLSVPLDINNWSNWGGQNAFDVPTYFAAAVASVSGIGLSFGGGCFFANGVGVSPGSASFTLLSYSVS